MSLHSFQNPWVFTLGILEQHFIGFSREKQRRFSCIPLVASLFSAMLWIYYATVRFNMLVVTINSIGCFIEGLFIVFFIIYAPKKARITTLTLLILLDFVGIGLIIIFTNLLAKGLIRTEIVGWLCVSLSATVYISPLSILRQVIRTKSVEFMPFWLSFSLILSAITWFFYGLLLKDLYIEVPNILGFIFAVIQMLVYFIYKKPKDFRTEKLPTINMSTHNQEC